MAIGNFSGNNAHSNLLYGFRIHPGLNVSTGNAASPGHIAPG